MKSIILSITAMFLSVIHAQIPTEIVDVQKVSARGYKDLYLVKRDMTQKEAIAFFAGRGATIATAPDARDLLSISDAAADLKIKVILDLRVVDGVFMAGKEPFKWPAKKNEATELKSRLGLNFTDKITSNYILAGERPRGGHNYRERPDTTTHQVWFVLATDPKKLAGTQK